MALQLVAYGCIAVPGIAQDHLVLFTLSSLQEVCDAESESLHQARIAADHRLLLSVCCAINS